MAEYLGDYLGKVGESKKLRQTIINFYRSQIGTRFPADLVSQIEVNVLEDTQGGPHFCLRSNIAELGLLSY